MQTVSSVNAAATRRQCTHRVDVGVFIGGAVGDRLFSVRGNQGEGWRPAEARYIGTSAVEVNVAEP